MKKISLALFILLLMACQPVTNTDPQNNKPELGSTKTNQEKMQAKITVQGYTSTLNHMDIEFLGKTIPYTYSDGKIGNSRGYDWWVSKHFALKSDLPKEKVTLYLELLEMAYPHYVALFGMEPPNIERQRIAVVYGSSRDRVREAMLDDGFLRGVHKNAGGETMFYNRAGYNFPSHREHHQRYIVIHETMHAFHMALNGHSTWAPNWITEGLADSVAHHVYDPKQKQLTVMVFDRAPMNYIETGLKQYYSAGKPTIEQINDDPALKRGLNFFIIHYLLSSPERAQYFAYFVEQLRLANPHSEATLSTANALLKNTFKDWQKIEQGFADFVKNIKPSFHIVSGPWEQNGNAYWLRNTHSKELSRLNINPAATTSHPVIDFPAPKPSPLVDLANSNQVAALIEFESAQLHRGKIGIALQGKRSEQNQQYRSTFIGTQQANDDQLLSLLIVDGERMVINAHNSNDFQTKQIALLPKLSDALSAHKKLAINLTLEPTQLRINLQTRDGSKIIAQQFTLPLSEPLITALNSEKISLLSQNNNHKITPYLFAHKASKVQLSKAKPALTNPWFFNNYALLTRVFKTCQQHTAHLAGCDNTLNELMAKLQHPAQHEALNTELEALAKSYKALLGNAGFSTLSGIDSNIYYHQQTPFLRVHNPTGFDAELTTQVTINNSSDNILNTHQLKQTLSPGIHNIALPTTPNQNTITVEQTINWQTLTQQTTLTQPTRPFNGVELSLTKTKSSPGNWLFNARLSGPYSGKTTGEVTLTATSFEQPSVVDPQIHDVVLAPYEHKNYSFELASTSQPRFITVTALLDVDGEKIQLVKQLK